MRAYVAMSLLAVISAHAQLDWKATTLNFQPEPGAEFVKAEFPFSNNTANPVSILEVGTTCGCTAAKPDKTTYAPGEAGIITAKFDTRGRDGKQVKLIYVNTNGPDPKTTTLTLIVDIPVPYTLTPRRLDWKVGTPPEMRTVRYTRNPKLSSPLPDTPAAVAGFRTERVVLDENTVEFRVTPENTSASLRGRIRIWLPSGPTAEGTAPALQPAVIVLMVRQ